MPYAIRKTVVAEGEEPDAFWEALGGKGDYQSEPASSPQPKAHEPQLLLFSEAAPDGLEELPGYTQDDLDDEAILLLDAFYTVLAQIFQERPVYALPGRLAQSLIYLLECCSPTGCSCRLFVDNPKLQQHTGLWAGKSLETLLG